MNEKDSPTSPSVGLFGYLFSGGAQKNTAQKSPVSKYIDEESGPIDIESEGFRRAYEEESIANMNRNRWSPSKTANLIEVERQKQKQSSQEGNPGYVDPIFEVNNVGAMREELEVEIETIKSFQGILSRVQSLSLKPSTKYTRTVLDTKTSLTSTV